MLRCNCLWRLRLLAGRDVLGAILRVGLEGLAVRVRVLVLIIGRVLLLLSGLGVELSGLLDWRWASLGRSHRVESCEAAGDPFLFSAPFMS